MGSVIIPNGRVEEKRRMNACIANAKDELDRELFKAAKKNRVQVPYRKLNRFLEETMFVVRKRQRDILYRRLLVAVAFVGGTAVCVFTLSLF